MSKHRIYISVCGEGLGHSSRALAVAEELVNRGCEVFIGSYGYAYDYLKSQKLCRVIKIPREWELKGKEGKFDVRKTFFSTLKIILTKYGTLINKEKEVMRKNRISCVISDGRISAVVAGSYHLGLPVLFVTNMTTVRKRFLHGILDQFIRPSLDLIGRTGVFLLDEILISDFPPPNDICYHIISKRKRAKKKTSFVGPIVNKKLYTSKAIKTKKKTVLTLVGGHEYRRPLIDCVSEVAKLKKDINFIVISRLIKKEKKNENLQLFPFVKNVYPYMNASDIIISQAGHSTTMEIICSGKTGILIPDKNQYEQEAIARRAKELKLCENITYDKLSTKTLMRKIELLLSKNEYKNNVNKLSKLAKKLNGSGRVAYIAIKYSSRMTK
jgi:UDP-N-acetylglucosamine--N-acetylmuramyl-(pentapeptide) pyrophosphoryl-undecaprenol N-acetylglucosamine transferase